MNRVQIADIEAGRATGSVRTLRTLADALRVTVTTSSPPDGSDPAPGQVRPKPGRRAFPAHCDGPSGTVQGNRPCGRRLTAALRDDRTGPSFPADDTAILATTRPVTRRGSGGSGDTCRGTQAASF